MTISTRSTTEPTPFVLALCTCHMIASRHLFNSNPTSRTILKITAPKPITQFFSEDIFTFFTGMPGPCNLAFPTKLKFAMITVVLFGLFLVKLGDFIASRVRAIATFSVYHNLKILLKLLVLIKLFLREDFLQKFKLQGLATAILWTN